VVPLALASPTLLAALTSAWWRSRRLVKAILPVGLAALVLFTASRPDAFITLAYLAVGVFGVCAYVRAVASYFATSFVAVALGFLYGGVVGTFPWIVLMFVFTKELLPLQGLLFIGFVAAGGLLGAVAGAARRRGVRTDFGVYPNPVLGPAVEVPAFQGPPLRFSAAQLRAMADLLDQHRQTFQLRPLVGRPTANAPLPAPDAGHPTPDGGRPQTRRST
jgi:hypothetical protein